MNNYNFLAPRSGYLINADLSMRTMKYELQYYFSKKNGWLWRSSVIVASVKVLCVWRFMYFIGKLGSK